jgi:hypothetical protein
MEWAALTVAMALLVAGCGTPGAPLPPSLNLPEPVSDLEASRAGNQVTLTWTMPKRNTDKLLLNSDITVRVCRKEGSQLHEAAESDCRAAGVSFAPGADGAFTDKLPAELASQAPRPLSYFVELRNRNGRSAGLSNAAVVLAGQAPAPVAGLTAEVRKQGVVLRWTPVAHETIRLQRKLLSPPSAKPSEGLLAPQPEPAEENLLVEAGSGRALDKNVRFGMMYDYRAQRVARVAAEGETLELDGEFTPPVRVEAQNVFPPETPTNLAAVASVGETGAAIDLSWQPVTDADLTGYIVYRREGESAWQRLSPAQSLVPPAFHDAQVQPGHSYRYAVSAINQGGHESPRSAETGESVPNP